MSTLNSKNVMELISANNLFTAQQTLSPQTIKSNQEQSRSIKEDLSGSSSTDKVSISAEAKEINAASSAGVDSTSKTQDQNNSKLTQEEIIKLAELKARDTEVRAHEQAHLAAAGGHATGGASYTFQKGPDGHSYAVGGEVGIDLSKENDPNATIQKMATIKRAAMAPASPSSTDRQVAAQASVKEAQARQELMQEQQEALLSAEAEPSASKPSPNTGDIISSGPSIGSLKASLAIYEQMSAM